MNGIPVCLSGNIVEFTHNGGTAVVKTEDGLAQLNIDVHWLPRLSIGDYVEVENTDCFITNGQIITCIKDEIVINDTQIIAKEVNK